MPQLRPRPPVGGNECAASPALLVISKIRAEISLRDLQEDVANVVVFRNLAVQNPWSVAQNIKWDLLSNGGIDSLSTKFFVPAFYWMLVGLVLLSET